MDTGGDWTSVTHSVPAGLVVHVKSEIPVQNGPEWIDYWSLDPGADLYYTRIWTHRLEYTCTWSAEFVMETAQRRSGPGAGGVGGGGARRATSGAVRTPGTSAGTSLVTAGAGDTGLSAGVGVAMETTGTRPKETITEYGARLLAERGARPKETLPLTDFRCTGAPAGPSGGLIPGGPIGYSGGLDVVDRGDILQKIHVAHSSAETSGLGDSLQRLHTLSSTETSGYGGAGGVSPTTGVGVSPTGGGVGTAGGVSPTGGIYDANTAAAASGQPGPSVAPLPPRLGVNMRELSPRSKRQHFKSVPRSVHYELLSDREDDEGVVEDSIGIEIGTKIGIDEDDNRSDAKGRRSRTPTRPAEDEDRLDPWEIETEIGIASERDPCLRNHSGNRLPAPHGARSGDRVPGDPRTGHRATRDRRDAGAPGPRATSAYNQNNKQQAQKGLGASRGQDRPGTSRGQGTRELDAQFGESEDEMNQYFEKMGRKSDRRGSYTPMESVPSSAAGSTYSLNRTSGIHDVGHPGRASQDGLFLGKTTESTWLKWSEERRESYKRRLDSIEQRQRELEKNRVPTPVRKARKESVMFVSPELEASHIIRDEMLELSERMGERMGRDSVTVKLCTPGRGGARKGGGGGGGPGEVSREGQRMGERWGGHRGRKR